MQAALSLELKDGTLKSHTPDLIAAWYMAERGIRRLEAMGALEDDDDSDDDDDIAATIDAGERPWCDSYSGENGGQHASSAHPDEWDAYKEGEPMPPWSDSAVIARKHSPLVSKRRLPSHNTTRRPSACL